MKFSVTVKTGIIFIILQTVILSSKNILHYWITIFGSNTISHGERKKQKQTNK